MSRTKNPSPWHLKMRGVLIDEGLTLDENSDAVIKFAEEHFLALAIGHRMRESADRCCDNCHCVALANVISALRAKPTSELDRPAAAPSPPSKLG